MDQVEHLRSKVAKNTHDFWKSRTVGSGLTPIELQVKSVNSKQSEKKNLQRGP